MPGRVVEVLAAANRRQYARPLPANGEARAAFDQLQAVLEAMRRERDVLAAQVAAFEGSTSWRLTRPLRWVMERLPRSAPPPPSAAALPAAPVAPDYAAWVAQREPAYLAALARQYGGRPPQPLRLVALPGAAPVADVPEGVELLVLHEAERPDGWATQARFHPVPPDAGIGALLARAAAEAPGLVGFVGPGEVLAPWALALVAAAAAWVPDAELLFGDEDRLLDGHRAEPFFKPGWNHELQRGRDLIGPVFFARPAALAEAAVASGPAWRYELASQLAAATRPERILHIPAMLCHRRDLPDPACLRAAAARQLAREGRAARVEPAPIGHRVRYALPDPAPLVSVIVPTRDHPELLRTCAEGLLRGTEYARLELLIADNGTADPEALDLLDTLARDPRVRVLRDGRAFNWSALNNAAAGEAQGEILLLLNNDIVVREPGWLAELVSQAVQPGVGAVGARLLYPDGRIQHAGVTTDARGYPRHVFRFAPGGDAGAFGLLAGARDAWGVTGACMAVPRAAFAAVGGLNEGLPVSYNDVDFCLRLSAHGYRIVWTPWAVLEHRELATRAPDHSEGRRAAAAQELQRLQRDWGSLVEADSFLHPALELVDEMPCLRAEAP